MYSHLHIQSANFGGIGGVDDTIGAVVLRSPPMAGIGVANNPKGAEVLLFPSMLLAR